MSDPFSVVAGAVGIASAFSACVDCFKYVQLGRHFGRDYQVDIIVLACERLRLLRWGEAIHIDEGPIPMILDESSENMQMARTILLQILALFLDAQRISKKHNMKVEDGVSFADLAATEQPLNGVGLEDFVKGTADKRQKSSNFFKLTAWALHSKTEFEELISRIGVLIDNLEKLFPPSPGQDTCLGSKGLLANDNQSYHRERITTENPKDTSQDPQKRPVSGHEYSNIIIRGKAQAGDMISKDWDGCFDGASHLYRNIQIEVTGQALLGNDYGVRRFWDVQAHEFP